MLYFTPMKHTALATFVALAVPLSAFALDYQHGDDDYSDARSLSVAERAAVSVLTDVGAVSGNPDGSFAPDRTLNRAEFAKIAMLSAGGNEPSNVDRDCFPDVLSADWFSRYVCWAKDDGAIEGNPDGLFHPERAVNYAEAVKILVELADYDLPEPPANERWAWYTAYLRAAEDMGVALPNSIEPAHELTRGQMARLAAAFVAEEAGELDVYRDAERGDFDGETSSSSSSSSSSFVSSVSSSSSSSSSVSSSSAAPVAFPAINHFLVAGTRTPMVIGGTARGTDESSVLRAVRLTLRRRITSINRIYMVSENGTVIAELTETTSDNTDERKYDVTTTNSTFAFPANTPVKVGIVFDLYATGNGGSSNELVEIESFMIQTEGTTTASTYYLLLENQVYPRHQTALGRITDVRSNVPTSGTLQVGPQRMIASIRLSSQTATGALVKLRTAEFILSTTSASVSNVYIGDADAGRLAPCGIETLDVTRIVCALPEDHTIISSSGLVASLYADIGLPTGVNTGTVHLSLEGRGSLGNAGSFVWTDESGTFNWIESDVPFSGNTAWTITR